VAERVPSSLAGKRVVVTRAKSQSATLNAVLRANGAEIVSLPLIRIAPPQDLAPLDFALRHLGNFDWLILTSQNAVMAIAARFEALGISKKGLQVAAVGKATAAVAQGSGFSISRMGKATASDLVCGLANDLRGKCIFLPRSDHADSALVAQLQNLGAKVADVVAYRTLIVDSVESTKRELVAHADAILFFSPSATKAFLQLASSGVLSPLNESIAVGAIGPVTFSALRKAGLRCDFQACEPSVVEIVAGLTAHFEKAKISSASGVHSR
jgi:uroporphyrinogen-III synthase